MSIVELREQVLHFYSKQPILLIEDEHGIFAS